MPCGTNESIHMIKWLIRKVFASAFHEEVVGLHRHVDAKGIEQQTAFNRFANEFNSRAKGQLYERMKELEKASTEVRTDCTSLRQAWKTDTDELQRKYTDNIRALKMRIGLFELAHTPPKTPKRKTRK